MNHAQQIYPCDLSVLNEKILDKDGKLIIKSYEFYREVDKNELKYFMLKNGIYVLPTSELIDWLKQNILPNAIEIGAGNGAIGRALGIPTTDSLLQTDPIIRLYYESMGQPVMDYPSDIEKLDAEQAISKYKPDCVVGAFITHKYKESIGSGNAFGVEEENILSKVQKYINIGNLITHREKPILKLPHVREHFYWLITRSVNQLENRIFIFNKK